MNGEEDQTKTDESASPSAITEPRLEDKTLPPAPKNDAPPEPRINTETPKKPMPAAPVATRRRLAHAKLNRLKRRGRRATTDRQGKETGMKDENAAARTSSRRVSLWNTLSDHALKSGCVSINQTEG